MRGYSNPERIYLDPILAVQLDRKTGRRQTAEYVRADLYDVLEAERDRLRDALERYICEQYGIVSYDDRHKVHKALLPKFDRDIDIVLPKRAALEEGGDE